MKLQKDKHFIPYCEADSISGSSCNKDHKTKNLFKYHIWQTCLIMQAFELCFGNGLTLTASGIGSQHHR